MRSHWILVPALLLSSRPAFPQIESGQPAFDAVSVKPFDLVTMGRRYTPLTGGPGTKSPGQLSGVTSMKDLLMRAWGVKGYEIRGPAWIDTEYYEIAAKLPAGATKDQLAPMLQNLLGERFHVAVHRESKELPLYALLAAGKAPRLQESDPAAAAEDEKADAAAFPRPKVTMGPDGFPQIPAGARMPGSFTLTLSNGKFIRTKLLARHQTMDQLADFIGTYANRAVRNLTGLNGQYDFTLAFESESGALSETVDSGPTLFAALTEQLGLRLEARKGPAQILVVDRVEKIPIEN